MNPRIRKLAEQAFIVTTDREIGMVNTHMVTVFAELIVRECVAEAKDDCAGWAERDQCLVMQVMERIKRHFGVDK
jgi:hypothetical protein